MRALRTLLFVALPCGVIVVATILGIILRAEWETLPSVTDGELFFADQSMVIEDRNGAELFRFFSDEDRTFVKLTDVPAFLSQAFIAIEDKRFYTRSCIDTRAMARAALANLRSYKSQGASTITQQLVRTVYLDRGKTFERKIREILLACKMEASFDRATILEQYLNWVSFGHGIAGVEQASRQFFGRDVTKIELADAAVLAAMPQRPSYFSPYGTNLYTTLTPDGEARVRAGDIVTLGDLIEGDLQIGLLPNEYKLRDLRIALPGRASMVLDAMLDQEYIDNTQYAQALKSLNDLAFRDRIRTIQAPHFVMSLKTELDRLIHLTPSLQQIRGLHVRTTIDSRVQKTIEESARVMQPKLLTDIGSENLSIVVIDRKTNEILGYVGSADFFDEASSGQIDMAREPRQVGSVFKPFLYTMLFEQGKTPESYIYDTPLSAPSYRASLTGHYGRMTMRTALARSRNVPAVRAFYDAGGEDAVLKFAESVGITSPSWRKLSEQESGRPFQYNWTLALGAGEASLLEMLQGYSVLASDGMFRRVIGIRSLRDYSDTVLFTPDREEKRVVSSKSAAMISDVLSDESARETGWQYLMHLPFGKASLKTGTGTMCAERSITGACTKLYPNNDWTIGYSTNYLVGVWVGNADGRPMYENASSVMSATPVWKDVMLRLYALNHPAS
ncbi:MAG: transglycosylase domain-containing protein [Candidatus Peribacteraceae bacterium]